ncbi:hypothetical protein [Paraburkholderia sacchari]|uniref:hypothetical protein n=2 Tax=Paraburkholderia sacchari TaxID=159450 RepID=UPI003D989F22
MSAGLGGYLAEHLRRHSPSASADETHFRDTAHGFLAWALATLFTAMLLTSAVSGIARVGLNAVSTHANSTSVMSGPGGLGGLDRGNALAACRTWPMGSLIDGLLRPVAGASAPNPQAAAAEQKQEIARIFLNSLPTGGALSPEDSGYVARIVAQNAGLAPADALARVTTTWSRLEDKARELNDAARAEADAARKATIHVALWLFVSLLLGAFTASLMATIGGPLSRSPSIYPHHHRLSDRSTSPPSERLSSP